MRVAWIPEILRQELYRAHLLSLLVRSISKFSQTGDFSGAQRSPTIKHNVAHIDPNSSMERHAQQNLDIKTVIRIVYHSVQPCQYYNSI
jgi:hypothetical protein